MFNDLYYRFAPPRYRVEPDFRDIVGKLSLTKRQLDVAVFDLHNPDRPFLLVESRRYNRKLDVNDVGGFATVIEDVGAQQGMLVCPKGFSQPAQNLADAKGIILHTLSIDDADRMNWREVVRAAFPWDGIQHSDMGDALHAVDKSLDVIDWIERLEGLALEEWGTVISTIRHLHPHRARRVLSAIAHQHPDDTWRFNAIQWLEELGWMEPAFRDNLMEYEPDPEVRELLSILAS